MIKKIHFALFALFLLSASTLFGQFATPTIDGSIGSGEYGTHTNGQNQETNGGQVWYMTWDGSNLYVGISGANIGEAAVIYIDADPIEPINGGDSTNGTIVGQLYDGINFAALQFRADFVCYVKNGYREYRNDDGFGAWGAATTAFGTYADNGGTLVREFSIPWSAITGSGRPASFAWFGYVTSSGGWVYAEMPTANPSGNIGTGARWDRYYTVSNTSNGSSTKPFSQDSYVFNSTTDITNFGAIGIFDFTMNSAGRTITRAPGAGGAWNIAGKLLIADGSIDFGSSSNTCDVDGNVEIRSNGSLTLSTSISGDLYVGDTFRVDGSFNCNSRAVFFDGNGSLNFQTITGTAGPINIDYFKISNSQNVQLNQNLEIDNELDFVANSVGGKLQLNDFNVTLAASAIVNNNSSSYYAVTNGNGVFAKNAIGTSSPFLFPIGTSSSYNPATITHKASGNGDYTMRVCDDVWSDGACGSGNQGTGEVVDKTWIYSTNSAATPSPDIRVQWNSSNELAGFDRTNCQAYYYTLSDWYPFGLRTSASGTGPYTFDILAFPDPNGILSVSSSNNLNQLLPLQFTSVHAKRTQDGAIISWDIADAINVDRFVIEKSTDGVHFIKVGDQKFDDAKTSYQFTDPDPANDVSFYRIKAVDRDGSAQYSDIALLPESREGSIRVWKGSDHRVFIRNSDFDTPYTVEVYNVLGQEILRQKISTSDADLTIPGSAGILIVRIGKQSFLLPSGM